LGQARSVRRDRGDDDDQQRLDDNAKAAVEVDARRWLLRLRVRKRGVVAVSVGLPAAHGTSPLFSPRLLGPPPANDWTPGCALAQWNSPGRLALVLRVAFR